MDPSGDSAGLQTPQPEAGAELESPPPGDDVMTELLLVQAAGPPPAGAALSRTSHFFPLCWFFLIHTDGGASSDATGPAGVSEDNFDNRLPPHSGGRTCFLIPQMLLLPLAAQSH